MGRIERSAVVRLEALQELEALMLWPQDAAARKRFVSVRLADVAFRLLDVFPIAVEDEGEIHVVALDADGRHLALRAVRNAPPWADIQKGIAQAFERGLIAGIILKTTLSRMSTGAASIEMTMREIAKSFPPKKRISFKTISSKIWPQYRSVAHFWAAYLHEVGISGKETEFPFAPESFERFCELADDFRRKGEAAHTRQSPTPLLRPNDARGLPESW